MQATARNALLYAVPEALWGFSGALTYEGAMPAAFAEGFGASEILVGATALAVALGLALPMLFTGWAVEPLPRKKAFVFWGHVLAGSVYGVSALLLRWAGPSGGAVVQAAYLAGVGVFFLSLGFLVPAWLALLGELIPEGHRGRVLGFVFVLNRLGAWAGGEVAHAVLASPSGPVDQWTLLFLLAAAAAVLGSVPFAFLHEEPRPRLPRPPLARYLRELVASLRGMRGLRRLVLADLLAVSGTIVIAHFGDVAIRRHGIDSAWAGRWTSATSLAQMAAAVAVAALGPRLSPRRGMAAGAAALAAAAAVGVVAGDPWAFGVVAALGGTFLTLRSTCHSPQVLRLVGGRDGTGPIGLTMALSAPVAGLGPFLAGWGIPALGHRWVFGAAAVACGISVALWLLWVPDRDPEPAPGP